MTTPETCPTCGTKLDPHAYGGLCPACLIGGIDPTEADTEVDAGPADEAPTAEELNQALPEYEVTEIIGRGGMGTVYRARQFELDRDVAIKLMARHSDKKAADSFAERFAREAQVTAQLDHPAIVPVHSMGYDAQGRSFYTMRLVSGRDFASIIALVEKGGSSWNLSRALGVLVRVCQAIAYAHAKGVIHRDIKPPNIMVGDLGEVYMLDWGLAKFAGHDDLREIREEIGTHQKAGAKIKLTDATSAALRTLEGSVIGTPAYMSPEQAAGKVDQVDHLADVYSLGAMLYHLLARHPPYMPTGSNSSSEKILSDLLEHAPEKLPELRDDAPPELVAICDKAMARDRATRYSSALALGEDIQAYLDGRVVRAYESGGVAMLKKWIKRNRALAAAAALALLCLIGGLAAVAIVQTVARNEVTAAFQKEQRANQESQENLADAYVSNGLREADDGQLARAQLWFTHAAEIADHDTHRTLANRLRAKNFGQAAANPIRVISDLPRIHYNAIIPHPELPFALLDDWSDQRWLLIDFENERWVNFEGGKANARYPAAAFEPGSDRIAISREDGKVELRSLRDLTLVKQIDLGADAGQVNALAFSPDGNLLFIGTQDARVWDRDADQLRAETLPHPAPPGWAKFSGNAAFLLTSTRDPNDENVNAVRAFSIGEKIAPAFEGTRIHRTHGSQKGRPAFVGLDGASFLTQEEHWQASIWETTTGEKKQSFPAEPSRGVSPGGRLLLSGREIRDLQTSTVTPLGSYGYGRLSPDASTVALEAPRHFYSVTDEERHGPLPPQVTAFPFEFAVWQDSTCLITARNARQATSVTLWRLPTESHAWELPVNGPFTKVSSSPDGQHIASAGNSVYLTARAHDQPITATRVYNLASRQPASDEIVPGAPILDTQFSPDGNTLAIALGAPADPDWDKKRHLTLPPRPGRIEFWDWKQSQRTGDLITLASEAHCLAYHPDGWLSILCVDGTVMRLDHGSTSPTKLFQIDRGEGIAAKLLTGHTRLAFSDDAKILIAGPLWNPGTVYAWDLQQARIRFTMPSTYAFTVSGDVLATTYPSTPIRISDGTAIKTPNNPGNYEFSLNADGTRLLAGGMVNSAQLWDLRGGQQLGRDLSGGNRHSGAFIDDTPWVATASTGRIEHPGAAVRLWDPQSGTLIAPELRFETSKSGHLQMFAATGFGALTGSQAICLDLRSLKIADWPGGANFTAADLKQLAELHAREVIEDSQVRELTPEAWLANWKEFRQKHPNFHQIGK